MKIYWIEEKGDWFYKNSAQIINSDQAFLTHYKCLKKYQIMSKEKNEQSIIKNWHKVSEGLNDFYYLVLGLI